MNNSENKNEGLNTISLGSVGDNNGINMPINEIPPIAPVPPVEPLEPMETLDTLDDNLVNNQVSPGVINNPIPPVNDINSVPPIQPIEPVAPIQYDIPEAINFNTTPVFNEIGTVPPIPDSPVAPINAPIMSDTNNGSNKKKSGIPKILFVLIVVLAITAVGVAVYIFLHIANNKVLVNTKNIELEYGSEISTNINDYATFNGVNSNNCSLDTTNVVDTKTLGAEYTYKIVCNDTSYTGNIKIVDTIKPDVKVKEVGVSVAVNGNITAESFIESCEDSTKCIYEFKDEAKVKEYLKTAESYHVDIIVKDEAGNETEVTGTLVVSNTVASIYVVCSKEESGYTEVNKFGLIDSTFSKTAIRNYTFKLDDTTYNTLKSENASNSVVTYNNITGSPQFNDTDKTLTLSKTLSYEELNSEAGENVPTSVSELRGFYQNKGYTCNIGY